MTDETNGQAEIHDRQESAGSNSFLSSTKGIVTGVTSLVIAITGLTVACDKLLPDDGASSGVESAAALTAGGSEETAEAPGDAPDEGPFVYTGDQLRMEWTGKMWQLSSPDGVFNYEEMVTTEGNWVLGFDKANDEYIRWPVDGGTMEYSRDDRQSWVTYGEVDPVTE